MRSFKALAVVGLAVALCGARSALADQTNDALTIIINEQTGLGYYQMTIGNSVSAWMALSTVDQGSWDSQKTTHGGSTAVGTTEDFMIDDIAFSTGGASYTIEDTTNNPPQGSWRDNVGSGAGYMYPTTEAALIVTKGGTSATSAVQNLVVMDNGGFPSSGILVYNPSGAPTQSNPQVSDYGYTNGTYSATGNGTPITEVGTTSTGLEGDLENDNSANDGMDNFAGSGNGSNIAVGAAGVITDPDNGKQYDGYELAANPEADVNGYTLTAGDDPAELFIYQNNGFYSYVSPTIIFEAYAVPLASPFWCGLGLMGVVGLAKLRAKRQIEA
jgi:hypothetical protein